MLLSDKYPFLTEYFTDLLCTENKRLPQSLLFYGNDFVSQYTLAKEIARLLNCKEDKSDDCECLNCKWIREDSHPAVMTISKNDNKPEDDTSNTVISIKQSAMIKNMLVNASEFHRVFIFCDRDESGNISGLNKYNFQEEAANSLLKIIEEPQEGITFIFITRYPDDVLPTIQSRSQCFFVPDFRHNEYSYNKLNGVFDEYWNFERKDVFDISQQLQDLTKKYTADEILTDIQNYILYVLKANPANKKFISDIKTKKKKKKQASLGIKTSNIVDDMCLKLIV